MKKITLFASALFVVLGAKAQVFSDDFESYSAGYLGPQSTDWTTWSNADGTTEDVNISTANAQSGTQSIYFSSTAAAGGPQDVILSLDQVYSSGIFTFQTGMMVPAAKVAHFNFQKTATAGQVWTLNVTADNGSISIDDAITADLAVGNYTPGSWFNIKIEANLTLGVWEAFIDGVSIGTWNNGTNQVAAVDFYPQSNTAQFYIDDVWYDHETYTLPNLNATASSVNLNGNIATQTVVPTGAIVNSGQTAITSFTATLNYNGNNDVINVTGVNIASLASYTVDFNPTVLATGSNTVTMTISNVNGTADDDNSDDVVSYVSNAVTPAPGKMVVGEEGTGTWCGWCPRGTVFMDRYENQFGDFWAGIAVHNGDPMVVADYDSGIGAAISGYPSSLVDRGSEVDPSAMSTQFYNRLQVAPTALMSLNPIWNPATRELSVEVSANFQSSANNNYKLACVLTEDHVTGTGSGYNQTNYYSSSSQNIDLIDDNGMNWKNLPASVPASQMEYNHVARAIMPSFAGDATAFPATVNAGETHSKTYVFTLPAAWEEWHINIVGMLIDPSGRIDNAAKAKLSEVSGVTENEELNASVSIYPNPATFQATLALDLAKEATVNVELLDMSGKIMTAKNYGSISGYSTITMNTSTLQAGIYLVKVTIDNVSTIERLVIQ